MNVGDTYILGKDEKEHLTEILMAAIESGMEVSFYPIENSNGVRVDTSTPDLPKLRSFHESLSFSPKHL